MSARDARGQSTVRVQRGGMAARFAPATRAAERRKVARDARHADARPCAAITVQREVAERDDGFAHSGNPYESCSEIDTAVPIRTRIVDAYRMPVAERVFWYASDAAVIAAKTSGSTRPATRRVPR